MHSLAETQEIYKANFCGQLRQWLVVDGSGTAIESFPTGHKFEATLAAARQQLPPLAAAAKALLVTNENHSFIKAIRNRVSRALEMVQQGHLKPGLPWYEPYAHFNELARCTSQTDPTWEHIIIHDGPFLTCTCDDWRNGYWHHSYGECRPDSKGRVGAPALPSGQVACKHILAQLLTDAATIDIEQLRKGNQS